MAKVKRYKYILVLLSILIICVIILCFVNNVNNVNNENFENNDKNDMNGKINDIDYYVITMGQPNRIENINKQTNKLNDINPGNPITIKQIDAVNGNDLNLEELLNNNVITKDVLKTTPYSGMNPDLNRRKYEVGCYLSHQRTYSKIQDSIQNGFIDSNGYSIIFEDDFEIQDNFFIELQKALNFITKNKTDFDILFLGLHSEKNDLVGSNIYRPNCENIYNCYYTHAYLIPNNKVNKLMQKMSTLYDAFDIMIIDLSEKRELIVYRVIPDIVNQNSETTGSIIRD